MAASQSYRDFVLEQLGRVTPVTGKSMFGGVGIYAQGLCFALIADDRLFFKVNDATRPCFERQGMEPFRPFGEDNAMGYYEVPANVVEDVAQLDLWMQKAIDVAATATRKNPSTEVSRCALVVAQSPTRSPAHSLFPSLPSVRKPAAVS